MPWSQKVAVCLACKVRREQAGNGCDQMDSIICWSSVLLSLPAFGSFSDDLTLTSLKSINRHSKNNVKNTERVALLTLVVRSGHNISDHLDDVNSEFTQLLFTLFSYSLGPYPPVLQDLSFRVS